MAQRDEMLALIRSAYAARDGGDAEGLVTAFHPEGAFTLMERARTDREYAGTPDPAWSLQ
jgi:hypothetical protein